MSAGDVRAGKQPTEEPDTGSGVGARGVYVVVNYAAVDAPSTHIADAVKRHAARASAAGGSLAQTVPGPRLARRRADFEVSQD